MKSLHINIISTEMDSKLFTDHRYNKKVYKALKKVRERYNITERHMVACYDNLIKVYSPKKELIVVQEI